jgi:hypothetical protein
MFQSKFAILREMFDLEASGRDEKEENKERSESESNVKSIKNALETKV